MQIRLHSNMAEQNMPLLLEKMKCQDTTQVWQHSYGISVVHGIVILIMPGPALTNNLLKSFWENPELIAEELYEEKAYWQILSSLVVCFFPRALYSQDIIIEVLSVCGIDMSIECGDNAFGCRKWRSSTGKFIDEYAGNNTCCSRRVLFWRKGIRRKKIRKTPYFFYTITK